MIGVCSKPIAIVMEFVDGGCLSTLLHDNNVELSWPVRLTMAAEIAQGIKVLHSHSPQVCIMFCEIPSVNDYK